MSVEVTLRNSQRGWVVDARLLSEITRFLLDHELRLESAMLGVHLIGARRMATLNWRWLQHVGSTDILTFDHRSAASEPMHGELFISVDDAVRQARQFQVTPGEELARYVVHGCLHLLGFDDLESSARKVMKREESRRVRRLGIRFDLAGLVQGARPPRVRGLRVAPRNARP